MSQGDVAVFNESKKNLANGGFNLDNTNDYAIKLLSVMPTVADLTPDSSDYTEVAGGTYAQIALVVSWDESAGVVTFDSSVDPEWLQDAVGPTDIKAALIFSTSAAANDALCFIDLTLDAGVTPISLQAGTISITWAATGIFTLT